MPWSVQDAKKKYPKLKKHQLEIWVKVANDVLGKTDDEGKAIASANAAVKNASKSEAFAVFTEIGRSISAANAKSLRDAVKTMQDAMAKIAPLLSEEEVTTDESGDPVARWNAFVDKNNDILEEVGKILAQNDSYDTKRSAISSALRKRAISDMISTKVADGQSLSYDDYYDYGCMPYICDLYDDYVVYRQNGEYYQSTYTIASGEVTLGEPVDVQISYVPSQESSQVQTQTQTESTTTLRGDLIKLQEKAVKEDGTLRIKLISPGWGSSGYYSEKMLKKDGPKVFKNGMHMYMNHPTMQEDLDRPERDVLQLAGALLEDAQWESASKNNTGAGLYANAKVFSTYKDFVEEAAPYIGVSIRASGYAKEGEAEGRRGMVIDELTEGYSVDYVTIPGRGGEVLSLYESAVQRTKESRVIPANTPVTIENNGGEVIIKRLPVEITQEQFDALQESATKANTAETRLAEVTKELGETRQNLARMHEAMILTEARGIVANTLASIQLPDMTRARLAIQCAANPPIKEDKSLDTEKLVEATKTAAASELEYLKSVTGVVTGGQVVGLGESKPTEITQEDAEKNLSSAFASWGLSETGASIAANGRIK